MILNCNTLNELCFEPSQYQRSSFHRGFNMAVADKAEMGVQIVVVFEGRKCTRSNIFVKRFALTHKRPRAMPHRSEYICRIGLTKAIFTA
ncbi:uncharacterized protein PHALS_14963 [Plasmopara halstedii]|uniref:Uncharacterized protein n=1 Tax=Plasmopara halstedii TaxID=4781 RepID=A0A0P1AZL3_PLAHL|nr:uncharacterized protein PHALS_14963 [Plasmopara halstedii]CEG47084.1 hypothetical protein PHALS_14963 [Plasmopara halstedii]|eukprot:XP_024583453.1 hypothetical protein PHALS_14963 [Plasmopara halstedii]